MNDGRPTGWPPTERQDQQAAIDADVMRLRTVHRAAADLRRGIPVLLLGEAPLILLAAETAGPRGLEEFAALAGGPPALLLAPLRAAAVLHEPAEPEGSVVALDLGSGLPGLDLLRSLADPTLEALLPADPLTPTMIALLMLIPASWNAHRPRIRWARSRTPVRGAGLHGAPGAALRCVPAR